MVAHDSAKIAEWQGPGKRGGGAAVEWLPSTERFRALIGLEAAAYQAPWYDDTSWLHRPDVHGGELCSALMSGLIAPQAPDET
jgi:hypothetical protein